MFESNYQKFLQARSHVRRIADSLGARRVGATWKYDAAEVTNYALVRRLSDEPATNEGAT